MDDKNKLPQDELPEEFASLEEAGEFWDAHSTADYEDIFEPVEFEIDLPPRLGKRIVLAADLADKLSEVAKQQGVSTETLANLWLQERLVHATS
ncbi:MAG: hypothetical protein IAF02_04915 [Anaerolineae bacterium]|nr:hypothetical protein [Anaerolineae bacterium]